MKVPPSTAPTSPYLDSETNMTGIVSASMKMPIRESRPIFCRPWRIEAPTLDIELRTRKRERIFIIKARSGLP